MAFLPAMGAPNLLAPALDLEHPETFRPPGGAGREGAWGSSPGSPSRPRPGCGRSLLPCPPTRIPARQNFQQLVAAASYATRPPQSLPGVVGAAVAASGSRPAAMLIACPY